jgi:apolipoprotein N-acyltransferase
MVHSRPFQSEHIDAVVHLMHESTVYERAGDAPVWILSALIVVFAYRKRRRQEG